MPALKKLKVPKVRKNSFPGALRETGSRFAVDEVKVSRKRRLKKTTKGAGVGAVAGAFGGIIAASDLLFWNSLKIVLGSAVGGAVIFGSSQFKEHSAQVKKATNGIKRHLAKEAQSNINFNNFVH